MKILVAGDLHASHTAARKLVAAVEAHNPDMVWQVGDFGYWPRISATHTNTFLDILESADTPIYFVDGNHEDHESLNSASPHQGVNFIRPSIAHAIRGTVLGINSLNVLFFGGAPSIDKSYRTPGFDWFPEERPSPAQFQIALDQSDIDVVVAHDVPNWVDFGYLPPERSFWPVPAVLAAEDFRRELGFVAHKLEPRVWFAGHHHVRKTMKGDGVVWPDVHVLNRDGYPGTFVLFDTKTLEVTET